MFVRTVAGDRSAKVLGFTHCHEHLFVFPTDGVSLPQRLIADDFSKSKEEVERFRSTGGGTLVDAQPFAAGRNANLLLRLSEETGVHIMTHTELSQAGREQAEYLMAGGVPAECIIISHMDRVIDIDKNIELARMGVFLEYDTIERFKYHPDSEEIELIGRMVEEGFAGRILLGMDTTRDRMLSYGGRGCFMDIPMRGSA